MLRSVLSDNVLGPSNLWSLLSDQMLNQRPYLHAAHLQVHILYLVHFGDNFNDLGSCGALSTYEIVSGFYEFFTHNAAIGTGALMLKTCLTTN